MLRLDELPQLINIIKGELVFIGPRPESASIVNSNKSYFGYLKIIKPGITDVSAIIFKNETKMAEILNTETYVEQILPVKFQLASFSTHNQALIKKFCLAILSGITVINHKFSLRIISKFFLPYNEFELRIRLNKLLSEKIF